MAKRKTEKRRPGPKRRRTVSRVDSGSSLNTTAAGGPATLFEQVERELVAAALEGRKRGAIPSARQLAALKRWQEQQEEDARWRHYRSITQKHWRAMSGRQAKVLKEQAGRYKIPFDGATINLPDVVKALHDFLAKYGRKLPIESADDALLVGENSPALERYRHERALMARLDRLERERTLLPRADVGELLGRIASLIRGSGDALQSKYGPDAGAILTEALDEAAREIARYFSE